MSGFSTGRKVKVRDGAYNGPQRMGWDGMGWIGEATDGGGASYLMSDS